MKSKEDKKLLTVPLVKICFCSLFLFLLTIGFSILLSTSKLNTFVEESIFSTYSHRDAQTLVMVERGLRFGRPLEGFHGLDTQLKNVISFSEAKSKQNLTENTLILDKDKQYLTSAFPIVFSEQEEYAFIVDAALLNQSNWVEKNSSFYHVSPIHGRKNTVDGYLVTQLSVASVELAYTDFLHKIGKVLLILTCFLLIIQSIWFFRIVSSKEDIGTLAQNIRKSFVWLIGGVQGVFIVFMLFTFAQSIQDTSRENALTSTSFLAQNLESLLEKDVDIKNIGLNTQLEALTLQNSEIQGATIVYENTEIANYGIKNTNQDSLILTYNDKSKNGNFGISSDSYIELWLDKTKAQQAFKVLGLDQLTALLIAFLLLFELSGLTVLIGLKKTLNRMAGTEVISQKDLLPLIIRSIIFFFFFASDMVLSFVPLVAGELPGTIPFVSSQMNAAFPTTVEALFAGVGIMLTGILNIKFGWKKVLTFAIIISTASAFLGALSFHILIFVLARAGSGLGFAMALMSAQLSVIENKHSNVSQVMGLAGLYAGLFAGSLCGSAGGAMAYELFGGKILFLVAGVFFILPLFMILLLPQVQKHIEYGIHKVKESFDVKKLFAFLTSYDFLLPVLFLSFPSSMMITGFIYYLVPTQLQQMGIDQGDIGRLFMLYSLCFILIGPIIGKFAEKTKNLRIFVSGIGLMAGFSMLSVFLFPSYLGFALGCVFTGISNSMMSSSMMVYILSLPTKYAIDEGNKGSSYRIFERIAQVTGPMLFSFVLLYLGQEMFLVFGVLFCIGSLLFILLSSSKK